MAISTPPPAQPPEGPSSTSTNSGLIRPLFPRGSLPQGYNFPPPPYPNTNLLYPPSRGFYPPNPNSSSIYTYRPTIWFQNHRHPTPAPLFPFDNRPNLDPIPPQLTQGLGFMGPIMVGPSSPAPPLVKGVPITKVSNQTPVIDNNGVKEARERSRDDSFIVVRDRKVRISEDSSLYALCRSWLRNGLPEETEPQYIDIVKSLPRPLPLAPQDSQSPGKKEEQEEDDEEEGGGFVEHLSPQDLLQKHIKRAKRVRSRLREERLRRIARYKTRLSLLLPPIVEQHYRNESTAGNGNTS